MLACQRVSFFAVVQKKLTHFKFLLPTPQVLSSFLFSVTYFQWRIQWAPGTLAPWSIFCHFHAGFGKNFAH